MLARIAKFVSDSVRILPLRAPKEMTQPLSDIYACTSSLWLRTLVCTGPGPAHPALRALDPQRLLDRRPGGLRRRDGELLPQSAPQI